MDQSDNLRVNFTLSPAAKQGIEKLRDELNAKEPESADILSIGWGIHVTRSGEEIGGIVIGFYRKSEIREIARGIQRVSGVPFVFFTIPKYHRLFEGKVLDCTPDLHFYLRD